jgi:acetoin utilization protein AcuB
MLVKDFMTRHPIMVSPEMAASEAQRLMTDNDVRHLPVVGSGKVLQGLITRQSFAMEPSVISSLDMWDITRYMAGLTVGAIMIQADKVFTADPDQTIEQTAAMMSENKIGCLPVLEDRVVIGILTEIDLMRAFQLMLGLPVKGVRVTVRMPNRPGEFARLSAALGSANMGVMGIGTYPAPRAENFYDVVLKIRNVSADKVKEVLGAIPDQQIIDLRVMA